MNLTPLRSDSFTHCLGCTFVAATLCGGLSLHFLRLPIPHNKALSGPEMEHDKGPRVSF